MCKSINIQITDGAACSYCAIPANFNSIYVSLLWFIDANSAILFFEASDFQEWRSSGWAANILVEGDKNRAAF